MDDSQLKTKQKQNKPEVQAVLGLGHEDSLRPQPWLAGGAERWGPRGRQALGACHSALWRTLGIVSCTRWHAPCTSSTKGSVAG